MLITFEGIDFSGKSTQIAKLTTYLEEQGKSYRVVREPGGNPVSEAIRDVILDVKHKAMIAEAELMLYAASRVQLVKTDIIPLLSEVDVLICDRFYDSTTAYQGFGRGLDREFIRALNNFASVGQVPDLTFYLDLSVKESYKRRQAKAGHENDRLESAGKTFFEAVRAGYLHISREEARFHVINASRSVDEIHSDIIEEIKKAVI